MQQPAATPTQNSTYRYRSGGKVKILRAQVGFYGALAFFMMSTGALAYGAYGYWRSLRPSASIMTGDTPQSHDAVEIYDLTRTPIINVGPFRYAILGLGQDSSSGRQLVWVRSLQSGRVGGYAEGAALFSGPVRVERVERGEVSLRYRGRSFPVQLALD